MILATNKRRFRLVGVNLPQIGVTVEVTMDNLKYNVRHKVYLDGTTKSIAFNRCIFNPSGWDNGLDREYKRLNANGLNQRDDSVKRSRDKVYDIAMLNEFNYFITLTLDENKISRTNKDEILTALKRWLDNMVRRHNLQYIIVPEYHKDGESIHFHGLIKGDLKLTDSTKKTAKGQIIYNLQNWKYGFSTCISLDENYERVCNYITKYITKDNQMVFGKSYFAGGKGLIRECETVFDYIPFNEINTKEYTIPNTSLKCKYL